MRITKQLKCITALVLALLAGCSTHKRHSAIVNRLDGIHHEFRSLRQRHTSLDFQWSGTIVSIDKNDDLSAVSGIGLVYDVHIKLHENSRHPPKEIVVNAYKHELEAKKMKLGDMIFVEGYAFKIEANKKLKATVHTAP